MFVKQFLLTITVFVGMAACLAPAICCPFCSAPMQTLSEMIDEADHLFLAKWRSGDRPTAESAGTATFEIVAVGRSRDDALSEGQTISLPFYVAGSTSSQYALMGPGTDFLNWPPPTEVTSESWDYLCHCPGPASSPDAQTERLAYFLDYLEHQELLISNDAFGEFAAAPYSVIRPLQDRLPREKLREWIANPDTPVTRLALYGLLLGLCGTAEDAEVMKGRILDVNDDFRLGLEGIMSGYVVITGEEGLRVLEDAKMRRSTYTDANGAEKQLPFSETYAAVSTIRFLKRHEPDRVPLERLTQAMHLLLSRPELSDLIIMDLARWKDWSVQERLMAMFDEEEFQIPSIKRAIVRYMLSCVTAGQKEGSDQDTEITAAAEEYLQILEEKDPKTVRNAKRFFIR